MLRQFLEINISKTNKCVATIWYNFVFCSPCHSVFPQKFPSQHILNYSSCPLSHSHCKSHLISTISYSFYNTHCLGITCLSRTWAIHQHLSGRCNNNVYRRWLLRLLLAAEAYCKNISSAHFADKVRVSIQVHSRDWYEYNLWIHMYICVCICVNFCLHFRKVNFKGNS